MMKNVKRYFRVVFGLLLISGAVWGWYNATKIEDAVTVEQQLDALPDHDYISEIRQLIKEKRYGEALILCEDVQKLDLPCAADAAALKAEVEKENKKIWNRIYKSGRAFITGNPDGSIEEIGGSLISDMIMYGDVRDLVKQGYFKLTKKETDPLIAALAAIGLATEFVDIADWAPAALKAMQKAGVITRKLADTLLAMCQKIIKNRKIDKSAQAFFSDTKDMLDSAGFIRTKNMFRNIEHADDLAILAQKSQNNPALTHLVSRHTADESVDVLKNSSPELLKRVARKGRLAVRLVKTSYKHHEVLTKNFWQKLPPSVMIAAVYILGISGIILVVSGLIPIFLERRKKNHVK